MKKLIVIALFVLAGIGHLSAEILLSSMERPDSGGKKLCIQPRYWHAVSFFNNDQYQRISKVKVKLTGNDNTNIKLAGRLYFRLEAEKKCKLDDNLIAKFKMTEVIRVPDGVVVTFEPMEKTILYPDTELFFVTGYGKYALDSFAVHPYDYVLKPIRKDKLMEIITELSIRTEETNNIIKIKTADGTAILDTDQIFFIEKEGRHSIIHSQQGCFDTLLSIVDLEAILPQQFLKTHSAYIVNISKAVTIKPTNSRNYQICFSDYEKTAWISRGGFKKYKALFVSDI